MFLSDDLALTSIIVGCSACCVDDDQPFLLIRCDQFYICTHMNASPKICSFFGVTYNGFWAGFFYKNPIKLRALRKECNLKSRTKSPTKDPRSLNHHVRTTMTTMTNPMAPLLLQLALPIISFVPRKRTSSFVSVWESKKMFGAYVFIVCSFLVRQYSK